MNLAEAFHQTVHGADGGCEALALRMGMSAAILRNKANPNASANKPMLDDADRIMALTGDYQILHAMAARHGHLCIQIDTSSNPSDMAVLELITQIWSTNGDVGAEVNKTLADGRIEAQEVLKVRAAIYRAQKAMFEMVARLDGMSEKASAEPGHIAIR